MPTTRLPGGFAGRRMLLMAHCHDDARVHFGTISFVFLAVGRRPIRWLRSADRDTLYGADFSLARRGLSARAGLPSLDFRFATIASHFGPSRGARQQSTVSRFEGGTTMSNFWIFDSAETKFLATRVTIARAFFSKEPSPAHSASHFDARHFDY